MSLKVTRVRLEMSTSWTDAVGVGMAAPHVAETARLILNRSRVLTPVRTGNLRASQRMTMKPYRKSVTGKISTKVKYAHFVHDGTRPHVIWSRTGKMLRFTGSAGQLVFRRRVWHPGTRGRPFLREAMAEVGRQRGYKVTGYGLASGSAGFGIG